MIRRSHSSHYVDSSVIARVERALKDSRLYLIKHSIQQKSGLDNFVCIFEVMGTTGNIYEVCFEDLMTFATDDAASSSSSSSITTNKDNDLIALYAQSLELHNNDDSCCYGMNTWSCACPDFVRNGKWCKHIYFVIIKILKITKSNCQNDDTIQNDDINFDEFKSLLSASSSSSHQRNTIDFDTWVQDFCLNPNVVLNRIIHRLCQQQQHHHMNDRSSVLQAEAAASAAASNHINPNNVNEDCVICFETMFIDAEKQSSIVVTMMAENMFKSFGVIKSGIRSSHALPHKDSLVVCATCNNATHYVCLYQWSTKNDGLISCPFCRSIY